MRAVFHASGRAAADAASGGEPLLHVRPGEDALDVTYAQRGVFGVAVKRFQCPPEEIGATAAATAGERGVVHLVTPSRQIEGSVREAGMSVERTEGVSDEVDPVDRLKSLGRKSPIEPGGGRADSGTLSYATAETDALRAGMRLRLKPVARDGETVVLLADASGRPLTEIARKPRLISKSEARELAGLHCEVVRSALGTTQDGTVRSAFSFRMPKRARDIISGDRKCAR